MTNYEEYRGFFVSEGDVGTQHVRCDPMQKEIFVIDNDKIFDVASWKAASGIKAYCLTAELVYGSKGGGELDQSYRWVNFCGGHAQGVKYAVNLRKIPTVNDPYSLCPGTAYDGCNTGSPIKYAKLTIVLPERTKQWLIDTKDTITAWLNRFPKEKNLDVEGTGVSTKSLKQFVDAINNPKKFEEIINFHINATVIHEVGHALGVPHHGGGVWPMRLGTAWTTPGKPPKAWTRTIRPMPPWIQMETA